MREWLSKAFNLSILQSKRWAWVDYLRGIAIVLVVYRHVKVGLERSHFAIPEVVEKANMIFFSFRMPLFFILSGMFISSSIAKRSFKKLAFIKFENLFYPYIVWAIIQITLQIFTSGYTNSNRSPIQYTWIFFQPRGLDQFWYLPALFNTSIIYLITKTKLHLAGWMQILLGISLYFSSTFFREISMVSDWMEYYLFFAIGDVLSTIFFKKSSQDFLRRPLTLWLVIPVFILTQLYYLSHATIYYSDDHLGRIELLPIVFIGCFSMFVLAYRLEAWKAVSFLRILGYHSLYIYVMHVIVSAFVRIVLTRFAGLDNIYILLFFGIAAGVIIPVMFYNLFIRDNFLWFLFSLEKPKRYATKPSSKLVKEKQEVEQ